MKKLNKKAFTLVEIVVAIGILAAASVGIGAIVVAVQNNSQKQFSQGDLQQQLSDVQDSLKNDLLTTNAGVKYWIQDDLGGYVESDGANKNPDRSKIVAMYAMDYIDNTLTRTYVKYDAAEDVLYKAELSETVTFDHSKKMLLDEKPEEVINDSSLDWYLYAQGVSNFSMDLSKYSENQTINYNVNLSSDNTDYESDNTVNIRNEIPINDATILENYDQAIITRPALQKNSFEYNGREITPKQLDVNSRYVEIRVADPEKDRLSATNVGKYRITYHLKNAVWSDGSAEDYTIEWEIVPRPLSVKWTDYTWIYDGTEHTARYELGNIADTDAMLALVTLHGGTIGPGYGTQTASLEVVNQNYIITENASKEISITKGVADYTIVPTPASTADNPLVYNGQPQALVNPGSTTCGTIYYSLSANSGFSTDVPRVKSANDETPYIVYYYIKGEGSYADSEIKYMEVVMHRAIPAINKPIPYDGINNIVHYNGAAQELLYFAGTTSASTANENNLLYSLDGDTYSSTIPTGVTAAQYTIWYKSKETADFKETTPQYVEARILKTERPSDSFSLPQVNNLIYNGNLQPLFVHGTGSATQAASWMYKLSDGEWTATIPEKEAAGDYEVYLKLPETADYAEYVLETPITVTIDKAVASYKINGQPERLPYLTYSGQPQNLVAHGLTQDGIIHYAIGQGDIPPNKDMFSEQIPQGVGAGKYNVFFYIKGDSNHYDSEISLIEAEILPANPMVTSQPVALSAPYNGAEQMLLIVQGISDNGTPLQYSLTGLPGSWSEVPPVATNVGDYTIYYKVPANDNYADSTVGKLLATITQANTEITAPAGFVGLVYDGTTQYLCQEGHTQFGEVEYSVNSKQQWSTNIPSAIDAGIYDIYWRVLETKNYKGAEGKITVIINKQKLDILPPAPNELTYTGEPQLLIDPTSGSVPSGYHFEYREADPAATWQVTPPMATDAGTYYVEYRVVANNHDKGGNIDSSAESLIVTIQPTTPTIIVTPASGLTYNGSMQDLIDENNTSITVGQLEYSLSQMGPYSTTIPWADAAGTYNVYWRTVNSANINPQVGMVTAKIDKLKIDFPVVSPIQMMYTGDLQFPEVRHDIMNVLMSAGNVPQVDVYDMGYEIVFDLANNSVTWVDGSTESHVVTWYITKGDALPFNPPISAPKQYTGEAQPLITTVDINSQIGSASYRVAAFKPNGATQWIEYSEEESVWMATLPMCTEVGEYKFLYKIDSFNYEGIPPTEITSAMEKGTMNVTVDNSVLNYNGQKQRIFISVEPLGVSSTTQDEWVTTSKGEPVIQKRIKIEVSSNNGKTWQEYKLENDPDYATKNVYVGESAPGSYPLQVRVTDSLNQYDTYINTTLGFTINEGHASWQGGHHPQTLIYNGTAQELIHENASEKEGMHFEYAWTTATQTEDNQLSLGRWSPQSTQIPAQTNAGTYAIKVLAVADTNYAIYLEDGTTVKTQELETFYVTIEKATIKIASVPYLTNEILYYKKGTPQSLGLKTGTLDGEYGSSYFVYYVLYYATPDSEPEPFVTGVGTTAKNKVNGKNVLFLDKELKDNKPKPTNAGTYVITWWVEGDANHESYYHIIDGVDKSALTAQIIQVEDNAVVSGLDAPYTGKLQQIFVLPPNSSLYLSSDGSTWVNKTDEFYNLTHKTDVGEYELYWKIGKSGKVQGPVIASISRGTLDKTALQTLISQNTITQIVFSTSHDINSVPTAIDVSEEQNRSVVAWIDSGILYISSSALGEKATAPKDSSHLLDNLPQATAIDLSGLNTTKTTDMSYMLYGFGSEVADADVHIMGLSTLATSSVANAAHMFENAARNTPVVYAPYLNQLIFATGADKTDWTKNFGANATIKEIGTPSDTGFVTEKDTVLLIDNFVTAYAGSLQEEKLIAAQWTATYNGVPVEIIQSDYLRVSTPYINDGIYIFTGVLKNIYGEIIEVVLESEILALEQPQPLEADTYFINGQLTIYARSYADKNIVTGTWSVMYEDVELDAKDIIVVDALTVQVPLLGDGDYIFMGGLVDVDYIVYTPVIEVKVGEEEESEEVEGEEDTSGEGEEKLP